MGTDLESRCKALEAQLRQAQRTETLGRLVGGVVHDFNNLLTVLLGYSEFVVSEMSADHPMFGPLTEIRKTAQRAANLSQRLLRVSRNRPAVLQPLDLNQVLREMDPMLRRILNGNIALGLITPPDLDLVNADLGELEQVILNLALNARDAMPTGGRLVLQTANVKLPADPASIPGLSSTMLPAIAWPGTVRAVNGERVAVMTRHSVQAAHGIWRLGPIRPGRYVMLAVSDSGCGMDYQTQRQVFEPFFTTKEPGKGTGLGLTSVEELVREHGGYIWLGSEAGRGTTFRIFLPRLRVANTSSRHEINLNEQLCGWETVLLLEEDESIRALTRQVFQHCGYRVLVADSVADALDQCSNEPGAIHLLVTDMLAPSLGDQLTAQIVRLRPEIKILLLSDNGHDTLDETSISAMRTGVLPKPFTPTGLLSKAREVLDR
jgi:signal transduction histidine kinase/CheY-like chemotaxis protein